MYFELLQLRLITHVQRRVHCGELTERGLARHTGISQPHLHNMLKGARVLSPQMADILLRYLHITLLDLLDESELAAHRNTERLL
jgi:plasmid maintenance system antidote protein VapI